MKNIALCYAGLPVNSNCSIDDFLEKMGLESFNIDMYACFWDIDIDFELIKKISARFSNSFISYVMQKDFHPRLPDTYFVFPETNVSRLMAMFYIRKKLFDLIVTQKKEYDAYIFVRFDVTIEKEINFGDLLENLFNDSSILIPFAGNFRNGYTDTIAVADRLGIKCYLTVYDRLLKIIESRQKYNPPSDSYGLFREVMAALKMFIAGKGLRFIGATPLHPETITKKNIELSGLNIDFFDVGDIIISRGEYASRLTIQHQTASLLLANDMRYISSDELSQITSH